MATFLMVCLYDAMSLMHIYVISVSINRMLISQLKRFLCVKFMCSPRFNAVVIRIIRFKRHPYCIASLKFYEKLHYLLDSWMFTTLPAPNKLIIEQAIKIYECTRLPTVNPLWKKLTSGKYVSLFLISILYIYIYKILKITWRPTYFLKK